MKKINHMMEKRFDMRYELEGDIAVVDQDWVGS